MKLIPKAKGGLSFSQAFAQARKVGLKTFKWRGGTYGTQLASEVNLPQMISMDSVQMPGLTPIKNIESLPVSPIQILTGDSNERITRGYTDEYGHRFTPHQAQQVVDMSGHKGYALVEDDEGNPVSRIGEALQGNYLAPGFYSNDKAPVVGSGLNEVNVTGHLTKITDKSTGFQRVNAKGTKNPVYQNTMTGEYYMTHPKTRQVMYSSPDEKVLQDPSLWTNYYTGMNGDKNQAQDSFDNNRGAIRVAVDRNARMNQDINSPFHYNVQNDGKVVPSGKLTTKQVVHGMNNAKQAWANAINQANPASVVNHTVTGGIKLVFDPNYKFDQYIKGFDFNHMNQDVGQVQGLGDLFNIENPTLRFTSNFINPTAVASSLNIKTTGAKQGFTNGRTTQIKVANPGRGGFSRQIKPQYQQFKGGAYPRGAHGKYAGNGGFQGGKNAQYSGHYNYGGVSHTENLPWIGDYWRTPATINVGYTPVFYNADAAPYSRIFETNILPQPYSVDYEPTINNDSYRAQMIYDASKSVAGSAGRDVRQTGNVTVGTSNGNRNELRSRGRKAFTSKRQKNKQSTGKTDTSNK